jgi:hypothetical protein
MAPTPRQCPTVTTVPTGVNRQSRHAPTALYHKSSTPTTLVSCQALSSCQAPFQHSLTARQPDSARECLIGCNRMGVETRISAKKPWVFFSLARALSLPLLRSQVHSFSRAARLVTGSLGLGHHPFEVAVTAILATAMCGVPV